MCPINLIQRYPSFQQVRDFAVSRLRHWQCSISTIVLVAQLIAGRKKIAVHASSSPADWVGHSRLPVGLCSLKRPIRRCAANVEVLAISVAFSSRTLPASIEAGRPLYTPSAFSLAIPSSCRSRRRFVSNSAVHQAKAAERRAIKVTFEDWLEKQPSALPPLTDIFNETN